MVLPPIASGLPDLALGAMTLPVGVEDSALRLVLAAVLGALIGWERGRAEKPADARTMMLISVGAAGFALIGVRVLADTAPTDAIQTDPTRVLAYIISGVGFLGAGAILHSKKAVRGLTTASSVWCTAAVGAACGLGEYTVGVIIAVIVLLTLWTPWVYYELTGAEHPRNGDANGSGSADEPKPETSNSGNVRH
jgi:putative Mg2+ transporter-C (MgtC) family protein